MKRSKFWLVVLAAVAGFTSAQTVRAITFGELDNGRHPNVGAVMLVNVPGASGPLMFLSGTLIGPRIFLTAAHGTALLEWALTNGFSLGDIHVTFKDDPYDESGWLHVAAVYTHPGYKPAKVTDTEFVDAHGYGAINIEDAGVLVLEAPSAITPVALPPVGFLDALKRSGQLNPETKFLAVGYGSHASFSPPG